MLAVVEIGGMQFEVQPDTIVDVPHLEGNPGDAIEFKNILLGSDNDNTAIGSPYLSGSVKAKIVEHGKGAKVLVFHKKDVKVIVNLTDIVSSTQELKLQT